MDVLGPLLIVLICVGAVYELGSYLVGQGSTWPEVLKTYQSLIGVVIALVAALIAYANISRQIRTQWRIEEQKRRFERNQFASALLGEISGILALLASRRMVEFYEEFAAAVENQPGPVQWWPIALKAGYNDVYSKSAGAVGKLPDDLPERVSKFYVAVASLFDRIGAAESGVYSQADGAHAAFMARLIVEEVRGVSERGHALIAALRVVREDG